MLTGTKISVEDAEKAALGRVNGAVVFSEIEKAAHIAGDMAMLEAEVNPVIKTLPSGNLEVVALHFLLQPTTGKG